MPFSPDYVRLVLSENFEDAKALFLDPLLAVHYAHLVMLTEQGIMSTDQARRIRAALDSVDREAVRRVPFSGEWEDLFFYVDHLIAAHAGDDVAGRLHTARSRNDIDMTMYRMRLREWLLTVTESALDLRRSLLEMAGRYRTAVFPAHTHTQPAQPTTLAHYLLGVIDELERGSERLRASYATTNRCPLGACAITGTGFPIDRRRTSHLLGFDAPTGNTYGSIATVDYLLESAAAAGVILVLVGRITQDFLLWSTIEVGYLRLADGFVQTSSIMPQKRNPVALEHARALASRALGELQALPFAIHNTPFGDIVDTEDDLQPLAASGFHLAGRSLGLLSRTIAAAEFDVARMRGRAGERWVTVTELADTLVRDHGVPFASAHAIVSTLSRTHPAGPGAGMGEALRTIAETHGYDIRRTDDELARILSPAHFIAVRRTDGGPAPEITARAIEAAAAKLDEDTATMSECRAALVAAEEQRRRAVGAL
jgi:argininosuccinate lyase